MLAPKFGDREDSGNEVFDARLPGSFRSNTDEWLSIKIDEVKAWPSNRLGGLGGLRGYLLVNCFYSNYHI